MVESQVPPGNRYGAGVAPILEAHGTGCSEKRPESGKALPVIDFVLVQIPSGIQTVLFVTLGWRMRF